MLGGRGRSMSVVRFGQGTEIWPGNEARSDSNEEVVSHHTPIQEVLHFLRARLSHHIRVLVSERANRPSPPRDIGAVVAVEGNGVRAVGGDKAEFAIKWERHPRGYVTVVTRKSDEEKFYECTFEDLDTGDESSALYYM